MAQPRPKTPKPAAETPPEPEQGVIVELDADTSAAIRAAQVEGLSIHDEEVDLARIADEDEQPYEYTGLADDETRAMDLENSTGGPETWTFAELIEQALEAFAEGHTSIDVTRDHIVSLAQGALLGLKSAQTPTLPAVAPAAPDTVRSPLAPITAQSPYPTASQARLSDGGVREL